MPQLVCNNTTLMCSLGSTPSPLAVLPKNRVNVANQPAANIMDNAPLLNIMPFGMCFAPTNPQVAAATAAAQGILTAQPCLPATNTPWTPGAARTTIAGQPAVNGNCQLACMWGGMITVTIPGQFVVNGS